MTDTPFSGDQLLAMYDRVAGAEDAIPRLRRFVLDLAVRGKLVEQDAGDEPASRLLERIEAEKERKQREKRIKRPIELEPVDVSQAPYIVPSGWQWAYLNDLTELVYGKLLPTSELLTNGFDVFGANGIIGKYSEYIYDDEMLLISCRGAYSGTPNISPCKCYVTNNSIVCELFDPSAINIRFLHSYLLVAPREKIVTGTAQPQVTIANAIKLKVPLPPLAEQHRIVAKVQELMALLDGLEAARGRAEGARDKLTAATLHRLTDPDTDPQTATAFALQTLPALTTRPDQIKPLRQTILNLAVRGRLTFDETTHLGTAESAPSVEKEPKPYEVHSSWKWYLMDDLVHFQGGSQPPKSTFVYEPREGYTRLVQIRDFKSDANLTFVPSEKANRLFKEDDVMIGRYGPPVFQILRGLSGTFNVALMKASPRSDEISKDFLFLLLQESRIHDEVVRESERTAGQTGVRLPLLRSFLVALPPLAEQHRIVAKVDALMALCDQLETALTTTATTRQRLLETLIRRALSPDDPIPQAAE